MTSMRQVGQDAVRIVMMVMMVMMMMMMMFLYRRARARLVQEDHQHNWDPLWGRFQLN